MNEDVQVKVLYQGKEYSFDSGAKAYIFHIGIYNDIPLDYGIAELLQYVAFVFECYLADDNRTPLGALADYMAEHWDAVKRQARREVLNDFYA